MPSGHTRMLRPWSKQGSPMNSKLAPACARVLRWAVPPAWLLLPLLVAACAGAGNREADEAPRNTLACQINSERVLIRFESGEARVLLPGAERVTLYRIPAAVGQRYSNGVIDLRGSGTDLDLVQDGQVTRLVGCAPYVPQK